MMMETVESALGIALKFLYALLAFGILIFFHELGHFLMAKLMRVRVLTFALGFGAKLIKFKVGETEYAVCAVPLGGYVKMLGEDRDEEVPPEDREVSFSAKTVPRRFLIVASGPLFNLLLSVLIMTVLHWGEVPILPAKVREVIPESPAAQAGLLPGDEVVAVDGKRVRSFLDLRERVMESEGATLSLLVLREERPMEVKVTPKMKVELSPYGDEMRLWQIGVVPVGEVRFESFGLLEATAEGARWTLEKCWFTVRTLWKLIVGRESIRNIGSPLLIGAEAAKQAQVGLESYLSFIAFVSVILAVMNLLPIPILDGSHLVYFLVEALIRRPLSKRFLGAAQYVGIGILVCLMAWAIYRDLDRFYWKAKRSSQSSIEELSPLAPSEPR